ncbi:MAG: GNAT family N-acetyltransferase [Granulosicoccaceae bacterium]
MTVNFYIADYTKPEDATKIVDLLNAYAQDPMGGGEPLSDYARENLADAMHKTAGAFSVIGELDGKPVALANCFHSLSTFACQPLVNIHDLAVVGDVRGQGVSQGLLAAVEAHARKSRCCKVTLEVLTGNVAALAAYKKYGFVPYKMNDEFGEAVFLHKRIS